MRRGDLVTIALQGDFGKPGPALVIQSDLFDEHPSITILPVTWDLSENPCFESVLSQMRPMVCNNRLTSRWTRRNLRPASELGMCLDTFTKSTCWR
jgi:mRNA-degrading endonuclease toxin of MazEF toxin-antitoxin module